MVYAFIYTTIFFTLIFGIELRVYVNYVLISLSGNAVDLACDFEELLVLSDSS